MKKFLLLALFALAAGALGTLGSYDKSPPGHEVILASNQQIEAPVVASTVATELSANVTAEAPLYVPEMVIEEFNAGQNYVQYATLKRRARWRDNDSFIGYNNTELLTAKIARTLDLKEIRKLSC